MSRPASPLQARFGRRTGWLANLTLASVSVVVGLTGMELAGRGLGFAPGVYLNVGPKQCVRRNLLLGYELIPSCAGNFSGTTFRTNAVGLRGPEIVEDGSIRLLALGDSCTWGFQVREEESYPAV